MVLSDRSTPAALAALLCCAVASPAAAGGFYIGDIGARGMGRGGAFVAAPDDLLAIHYNPAGLSFLRGLHIQASLALVDLEMSFARACPCVSPTTEGAADLDRALQAAFPPSRTSTPLAIPFLGLAYGLPVMDLTLALAAYGPNSGRHDYGTLPDPSSPAFIGTARTKPSRYSALNVRNLEVSYALGAAFSPVDGLRLGGTLMLYQTGTDQTVDLWVNSATLASEPEDPRFDVPLDFHYRQDLTLNWSLGASYQILPGLTVGASYRALRHVLADGTVGVGLPELLIDAGAGVSGDRIQVELKTAPIGRLGVEYKIPGLFTAEAAVVAEWWSVHQRITVTPQEVSFTLGTLSQALGPLVQERQWRDTYALRLGGELNAFEPWLSLRAGYFYEPSAIAPERVDPSRVDLDKHGFALGAATELYGVKLELSAMYVTLASETIADTTVRIKAPLVPPLGSDQLTTLTGNGTYQGEYFIGALSLAYALEL